MNHRLANKSFEFLILRANYAQIIDSKERQEGRGTAVTLQSHNRLRRGSGSKVESQKTPWQGGTLACTT